ncbi:LOW QUALITY PROTEIN: potassium channel subfamily K member 6 [Perca flavescens]|uniref:LOW QUALITY PROTEIN: potassium channel subfamily K member 6 n=1 Tax=Perca flavescens TaxID=8167 RepID=UPI00106EFB4D|nr:LOW QUALITY PROTEIN: potassium channel subfamily K member 6-like [Perca flavescens]
MNSVGRSWLLLTGFVLFYVIYLLFGALMFSSIERPVEDKLRQDMEALKQEFLNQSCVNSTSLELFLVKVLTANKYGVSVLGNSSVTSNWDLTSSMFFANTLVTTVGYGQSTPLSDTGKAFSILYALIGVPFTMLVLTACVQRIMCPLVLVPVRLLQRSGMEPRPATVVHFLLLLLVVVVCFFVVPAAVFSSVELSWSFLDGIYFCFISLCTIGLGDFVPGTQPGQKYRQLYQVTVMVYLFLGLMMMYLLLRTFHKMADLHGLTTFLQLPHCDESDLDDREPIVEDQAPPCQTEKRASKHLKPGSQPTYNTINSG